MDSAGHRDSVGTSSTLDPFPKMAFEIEEEHASNSSPIDDPLFLGVLLIAGLYSFQSLGP